MIKKYFIAGLLVWLPIWITLLVIKFMVDLFDASLSFLPAAYQPDHLLGFHLPGLGVIFVVIVMLVTGLMVRNFLGHRLVHLWEQIVGRIPLVRSIYNAVKQVMNTILSQSGESFRRVLLVQYPRLGMWSIAFQTGRGFELAKKEIGEDVVTVFIPTTPNPTSGFLMIIPRKDAVELDISVDEALKMVVSLGVVVPKSANPLAAAQPTGQTPTA